MFQSTRPRGARPAVAAATTGLPCFNPRAHAGRDLEEAKTVSVEGAFQSTRPRGARQGRIEMTVKYPPFQSTRPRGARRSVSFPAGAGMLFQSTRPRGARP